MRDLRTLSTMPGALKAAGHKATPYRSCYAAAIDARIPVARTEAGRWVYDAADLEAIATALNAHRTKA
jgi:hypothetical protein